MLPALLDDLTYRLRKLFARDAAERDLATELELHLDLETERLVRAGVPPDEARRRARLTFGGLQQISESARDAWGTRTIDALLRDTRRALRLALAQPVFSAVITLSLALGLAATLTVINVAYNVLLAPLALPRPHELITLMRWNEDGRDVAFQWREVEELRATPGASLAALRGASAVSFRVGDRRIFINLDFVDGNFFSLMGAQPLRGRLISPADDSASAPVVVVSREFAEKLFPGDSNVVGRVVDVRGAAFTIIGVTPDSFRGVKYPAWFTAAIALGSVGLLGANGVGTDSRGIPYGRGDDRLTERFAFQIVGRTDIAMAPARAALEAAFARCCGAGRDGKREWLEVVDMSRGIPFGKGDIRREARGTLAMILAGMGLLLVVVCCNVASLLLVRATARQREMAVRLSLGASRARLASQLIVEVVPLAVAGGTAGLLFAAWFTRGFASTLPADWVDIAPMFQFTLNPLIVGLAAALTAACTIAFSVYPAVRAARVAPAPTLRMDGRASRTRAQGAVARGVIVVQVALTVVLVTSAALLSLTLVNLTRTDVGIATDHTLLVGLGTRSTAYEAAGVIPVSEDIARAVEAVPGVRRVTMATNVPLYGGANYAVRVDIPGVVAEPGREFDTRLVIARERYFSTSGLRIVAGRELDASSGGPPAVVVNQTFARRYLRGRNPLGQSIGVAMSDNTEIMTPVVIAGVSADAPYSSPKDTPRPYVYAPLARTTAKWQTMQLVVRSAGAPAALAPAVLEAIESAAPGIETRRVRDMETQRAYSTATERISARLAAFVSGMTLMLAVIGLYGVVAYGVSRRVSEIGVRLALGARAASIVWLVTRETTWMIGLGVILGVALSFGATGAMQSQLYGITAHHPLGWLVAALTLGAAGIGAAIIPARRATRIDPRLALIAE